LSTADVNYHQDLNFALTGAPQTPSMKPNYMGGPGYLFNDYHQWSNYSDKRLRANSADEFGKGILDQHDDPLINDDCYRRSSLII